MNYQSVPQYERKLEPIKHKRLQQSFYCLIGLLFVCLGAMLILITLDILGILKYGMLLQLWIPASQVSLVQTQTDQFYNQAENIESELNKLKTIFHEQLIETSKLKIPIIDKSEYEYFTLENGLKVLVIQDSSQQIAQAALCVNVGSWTEPDDYPGLAHFLEHMLFQGSQTYPQEGYFQKLVAEGGGSSNAYTRAEETNFYFKINNDQILQALQVFAHFFIDPLLDASMVDREVNAVNSEYEIAVSGDGWKIMHLIQILSKKPVGRFTIGSLDTLKDPMDALIKFHQSYYSSNIMSLVVKSNYKDMGKWIREQSDFTQIPNLNLKKGAKVPLPLKSTGQFVKYKVNGDKNTLILVYQLQSPHPYKKTKPLEMISQVIRSKHANGLQDYLINKKIALSVDAGTFLEGNGDFTFFMVELNLQDQVSHVEASSAVIAYFNNMLDSFFEEINKHEIQHTNYLEEVWNQYKKLAASQFNYLDKNNQPEVKKIAHNLNYYDYKEAISIDFLYEEFNPEIIYNYLSDLVNPSNLVILQGSPKFTNLKHSSQLYRLEYEIQPISQEIVNKMSSTITTKVVKINNLENKSKLPLELPPINEFIPKDFNIKTLCHDSSFIQAPLVFKSKEDCIQHEQEYENINHYPQIIKRTLESKVWWKLQRSFQVPQIYAGFLFSSPKSISSLKDKTLVQFFNNMITDNLNSKIQEALDAGYQFQFTSTIKGVSLELYGWNDNYERVASKVLNQINNPNFDQFQSVKQKLFIYYNNIYQDKIFRVATSEYLQQIMQVQYYTPQQYIEQLKTLDEQTLHQFKDSYFKNFKLISFITGNILRDEAEDLAHLIKKEFHKSSNHAAEESHTFNVRDLQGKQIVVPLQHKGGDENDINGVTLNYYQIGHRNKKNFAIMNLIQQFFHNHAFQYLRTERQLGYAVMMRFTPIGCVDGGVIIVQGTAQMPYAVNKHIEEFLLQFNEVLINLADEQLESIKTGARSNLEEKDKSLYEEGQYIWGRIKSNNIILEERELAIAMIEEITKDDILNFYQKHFITKQNKLSLQIYGKGLEQINEVKDNLYNKEEIIDIQSLKEYKCSYSLSNI